MDPAEGDLDPAREVEMEPALVAALSRWVTAIMVVEFDLEIGQSMRECFPPNALLAEEVSDVAFLSFPDSISGLPSQTSVQDCMFDTRFRRRQLEDGSPAGPHPYLYQYVFCRQRTDPTLKRGGEQHSVVVLSHLPHLAVFKPLLQVVGPLYFNQRSAAALRQVAEDVARWSVPRAYHSLVAWQQALPAPQPGAHVELSVAQYTYTTMLPLNISLPRPVDDRADEAASSRLAAKEASGEASLSAQEKEEKELPDKKAGEAALQQDGADSPGPSDTPFPDVDLHGVFNKVLMKLWCIWELMLLGEPIMVVAPTPAMTSQAVAALLSLVAPLPSTVDFRPYFTIHDPIFNALACSPPALQSRLNTLDILQLDAVGCEAHLTILSQGAHPPPMILGVTNLFFLKAIPQWPHVLSVGYPMPPSKLSWGSPLRALQSARLNSKGPGRLLSETVQGLWTTHTPVVRPDAATISRLVEEAGTSQGEDKLAMLNNAILRRHFTELTHNFLAAFSPYIRGSLPQPGQSPFAAPPKLKPYNPAQFLQELARKGPEPFLRRRMRSNWLELYRRFVESENCKQWLHRRLQRLRAAWPPPYDRRAAALRTQQEAWRRARTLTQINNFLSNMDELQLVNVFAVVENQLAAEVAAEQSGRSEPTSLPEGRSWKSPPTSHSAIVNKLRRDLWAIYEKLPRDVQQTLSFSPQRAALLQGFSKARASPGHLTRKSCDDTRNSVALEAQNQLDDENGSSRTRRSSAPDAAL